MSLLLLLKASTSAGGALSGSTALTFTTTGTLSPVTVSGSSTLTFSSSGTVSIYNPAFLNSRNPASATLQGTITDKYTDGASFDALPGVTRTATGRLLATWSHQSSDGSYTFSYLSPATQIMYSDDEGSTWSTPTDLGVQGQEQCLTTLANGNIVHCYAHYTASPANAYDTYITYIKISTDNGATWGSEIRADANATGGLFNYSGTIASGPVVQVANGDLYLGLIGGSTAHVSPVLPYCKLVKSTDGGATWAYVSTILDYNAAGPVAEEPNLAVVQKKDGTERLLCAYRSDLPDWLGTGNYQLRAQYSDDYGATWSASTAIVGTGTSGRPQILQTASGAVQLSYRDRNTTPLNSGGRAVSLDYGATFTSAGTLTPSSPIGAHYYAQWVNLNRRGEFGIIFAQSNSSAQTPTRIYWAKYAETEGPNLSMTTSASPLKFNYTFGSSALTFSSTATLRASGPANVTSASSTFTFTSSAVLTTGTVPYIASSMTVTFGGTGTLSIPATPSLTTTGDPTTATFGTNMGVSSATFGSSRAGVTTGVFSVTK